jgi:hypothetical protein
MKTSFNSLHSLAVSVAAFLVLTVNAVATAAVFAVAGTVAVLAVDYGRRAAPRRAAADVIAFGADAPDEGVAQEAA